mmetsp:Transcript_126627/g.218493  ORF Transcript_126627/g.218493 Transcript_126627/m.218493 type:complete len:99 (+) Transcript_126627:109-405(+)
MVVRSWQGVVRPGFAVSCGRLSNLPGFHEFLASRLTLPNGLLDQIVFVYLFSSQVPLAVMLLSRLVLSALAKTYFFVCENILVLSFRVQDAVDLPGVA